MFSAKQDTHDHATDRFLSNEMQDIEELNDDSIEEPRRESQALRSVNDTELLNTEGKSMSSNHYNYWYCV